MPLKLNVGVAKKIGQPNSGTYSASCHLGIELDAGLLHADLDGLQQRVRGAFAACRQAVNDELAREQPVTPGAHEGQRNGQHEEPTGGNGQRRSRDRTRRATTSQVRAIETIAKRHGVNLAALLSGRYEITAPEDLSIVEASRLIDELKELAEGNGDRR